MKLIHNEENRQINILDERFYLSEKKEDVYYPSVTTILDAYPKGYGYTNWLKQVGFNADEIVKKAGDEGSRIHEAIERILQGFQVNWMQEDGTANYNLNEWQMICKFMDFYNTYNPQIIHVEQQIVSDELRVGGTVDFVCVINGEKWLIDFKSSNAIYESYYLQIAKYVEMWQNKYQDKIDRYGILWLKAATRGEDKSGKKIQGNGWQIKESPKSLEDDLFTFNATQHIWERENPNYKPKNLIYPDYFVIEKQQTNL